MPAGAYGQQLESLDQRLLCHGLVLEDLLRVEGLLQRFVGPVLIARFFSWRRVLSWLQREVMQVRWTMGFEWRAFVGRMGGRCVLVR